jgi:multidrug efflux pump subunit AcrB
VLGHWLFGAPFTATSMIGFIALAGIIVRNSILLTALAAMIGAATILSDPIFQGLAISLLFGLAFVDAADRAGDPVDLCGAAGRGKAFGIHRSRR